MAKRIPFQQLLDNLTGAYKKDIASFSRYYGQFNLKEDGFQYYYLGGGNTSINEGNILFVKLSGHRLSTIEADGFGEVNVQQLLDGLQKLEKECSAVLNSDYTKDFSPVTTLDSKVTELFSKANAVGGDPSVESGLHAQLAGTFKKPRWNLHDHNTIKNYLLCSENAEQVYKEIFGDDPRVRFMDFVEPGALLSIVFNRKMNEWKNTSEPNIILMAQHGAIQTGYPPQEIYDLDQMVVEKISSYAVQNLPEYPFGVKSYTRPDNDSIIKAAGIVSRCFDKVWVQANQSENDIIMRMLFSEKALKTIKQGMPNPDAVVYGGAAPLVLDFNPGDNPAKLEDSARKALGQYKEKYKELSLSHKGYLPKIIIIPGLCVITIGESEKQADNAYAALLDTSYILSGAEAFGGMKPLSDKHLFYITNWAAEQRREKIASR